MAIKKRFVQVFNWSMIGLWGPFLSLLSAAPACFGEEGELQKRPLRIVWDYHPQEASAAVLDWLEAGGWCWGIETPFYTEEAALEMLHARGWRVVYSLLAHPETRKVHWTYKRRPVPDFDQELQRYLSLDTGEKYVQYFTEDDSAGVGFSRSFLSDPPQDASSAYARFKAYLEAAMAEAGRYPEAESWGLLGYAKSAHLYGAAGIDCLIAERANDDVADLQTALAFCRGAARQYGCDWGVDLSLWWGVFYGCVQDLPASLYRRHLYHAYASGARTYRMEGGDLLVNRAGKPSAVAVEVDAFAKKVQENPMGDPVVPAAILLAPEHGWMTPPWWRTANESWDYARLPYRPGHRGMDGFFGAAFPAAIYAMDPFPFGAYEENSPPASPYALSCITPEFAPRPEAVWYAEAPIPFGRFKSRDQAREVISSEKLDPSPYRAMADTRWGDSFDVLTTEASLAVLRHYPVVMLLGPLELTDAVRQRLRAYVEAGGRLIAPVGILTPEDAALVGGRFTGELGVGRSWCWGADPCQEEAFRYAAIALEADTGVEVLAATPSGKPLVLRRPLGTGAVYTCLAPWFEAGHQPLSRLALTLFDTVLASFLPVKIDGPPVAWRVTQDTGGAYVVITNNDDAPWQGKVGFTAPVSQSYAQEWFTGEAHPITENSVVLRIPPYDLRILRIEDTRLAPAAQRP